jgi:hypothetical protein
VDLDDGSLQVRRTLSITKNGPVFTSPKTTGSRRSVKLTNNTTEALKHHLERQLGEIGSDRCGALATLTASYSPPRPESHSTGVLSPS